MDQSSTSSMSASLDRPHSSASASQYMNRTAAALSSWGDQSVRAEQLNEKLVRSMRKARTPIPGEWFDKQYAIIAKRDEEARKKTQALYEARRAKCLDFADTRRRTLERLHTDIRPQQQREREQLRKSFENRIATSSSRLAADKQKTRTAILERKKEREEAVIERREFFKDVRRTEEQRAADFQRIAEGRKPKARRAWERRLSSVSEKAQKAQALREEAEKKRQQEKFEEQQVHRSLMDKHHGLSEWLKSLDEQKRQALWQRRVNGVTSTLQRQAILQLDKSSWHETLRATPLPENPKEIQELAEKMTPIR